MLFTYVRLDVCFLYFLFTEIDPGQEIIKKELSEEQQQLPPAPLLAHETLSSQSSATGAPVSLLTSSTSNRESPSCPDSTTSPSPLMTSMAAASTAPAGVPVSLSTGIAASTPAGVASNLKHAGGGPQVTTAHALALLPTLYSAYPAAAAAAATGSAPPGLFSFFREINFTMRFF